MGKISNFGKDLMYQVNLKEAENLLPQLIEAAAEGEKVVITRSDGSAFKIVPVCLGTATPKFGSAKGLVEMSDDFDEPLEGFEAYAP
jgi:antitoxin (DNA-binding transcriptional repressor) of toxin-antitoxin stability system